MYTHARYTIISIMRMRTAASAHYAYWPFTCSSFSRHISRTLSFQRNRHVNFLTLVALKLLVSLISRLVACSARIVVDRQTHRTTTVTLAAHARRGLMKGTKVLTYGGREGSPYLLVQRTNPRRRALAIRMRYMCTYIRIIRMRTAN